MRKRILIVIIVVSVISCSSQKKEIAYKNGESINVTGVVTMTGNEPFTRMVLRPVDDKEPLFLPKNFKVNNVSTIGKTLTVIGIVEVKVLKSADHKYTVYEYHLNPVKIDKIETQPLK
jgi:hypothetical protein